MAERGFVQFPARPFQGRTDGHRENPRFAYVGNTSVPCRWWSNDFGFCARCGSQRPDLHDGMWDSSNKVGIPWDAETRRYLDCLDLDGERDE